MVFTNSCKIVFIMRDIFSSFTFFILCLALIFHVKLDIFLDLKSLYKRLKKWIINWPVLSADVLSKFLMVMGSVYCLYFVCNIEKNAKQKLLNFLNNARLKQVFADKKVTYQKDRHQGVSLNSEHNVVKWNPFLKNWTSNIFVSLLNCGIIHRILVISWGNFIKTLILQSIHLPIKIWQKLCLRKIA